jgi:hypothetical protein
MDFMPPATTGAAHGTQFQGLEEQTFDLIEVPQHRVQSLQCVTEVQAAWPKLGSSSLLEALRVTSTGLPSRQAVQHATVPHSDGITSRIAV